MMAFARRGFVDAQLGDRGGVVRYPRLADPMAEHGPDALRIDPQQFGDSVDRHFSLNQGQCQGLEQQGKTAARTRPRHHHRDHFAIGCDNPWHGAMKVAGVLEEAQVLPVALPRIMDRTGRPGPIGKPRTRGETDREVQLLAPRFVRSKGDLLDPPGRLYTKGHAE